ncbi:hypothetical protein ONS95_014883 [Cadophora gregata]|uniref:uncharacterized protein n=1 Tax=Cadophora gregata TaxID=51156 RepID=UPI0026DAE9AF|nr:uncharacterized protein ONS95_014883 [Cadophora gregata]KAK0113184.1 hypothetical protein ONS95_014883 [Cadophora gregata]
MRKYYVLSTKQLTPILSILLVHDLLLAKRGIALPATHGLRTSVERHKGRLHAEFVKARVRRKVSSVEAFKAFVEGGLENGSDTSDAPYPRWVRINTLKTSLEEQLETTFAGMERATSIAAVRKRGAKRLFIDGNIPNLVAVSPNVDLSKSDAYKAGCIIFQDKASCFPAYLLDPLPQDGNIIDTCSAPGNKTTHLAAIVMEHSSEPDECSQTIHAFEKNKGRAETLEKMINLAGSHTFTKLHPGHDFLKSDPKSSAFKKVGALLLDPSCSGSGIIGRDDMPELHLPVLKQAAPKHGSRPPKRSAKPSSTKAPETTAETRKRKREDHDASMDVMVDDDGEVTAINSEDELKNRLEALSNFQLELLLHAFKFPAAQKITYSTCSLHAEENENVVQKALEHPVAKQAGWRILKRDEQIRGMKEWPVRGSREACAVNQELAESCIRANKDDEHGTMGFFLAGFIRDSSSTVEIHTKLLRDERGHLIRDVMGFPVLEDSQDMEMVGFEEGPEVEVPEGDHEWVGFEEEEENSKTITHAKANKLPAPSAEKSSKPTKAPVNKHAHSALKKRTQLVRPDKKRKKAK